MENIHRRNFVRVNEIDPSPKIYEELGNGKLRAVNPAELGIEVKNQEVLLPRVSSTSRSNNLNSRVIFNPPEITIHERMADGRMRLADPAEFGIKLKKPALQFG